MDRSTPIQLLSPNKTQNSVGVWETTYTPRLVFAQVDSVSRAEFFDGGRNGLNPEFRMTLFFGDYQGERLLRYNGQTYSVYRTYQGRTDELELYVERQGGSNGQGDTD
jgi:hypothetical protein